MDRKEAAYRERAHGRLHEIEGFSALLETARFDGWAIGLATGAGPENIEFNLVELGLADVFDTIVGANDVVRGKPHPETFLTSAARLDVTPRQVIVFEDAPMGIEAAASAGMAVIGVTTMLSDEELLALPAVRKAVATFSGLQAADLHSVLA